MRTSRIDDFNEVIDEERKKQTQRSASTCNKGPGNGSAGVGQSCVPESQRRVGPSLQKTFKQGQKKEGPWAPQQ